MRVLGIAGSLRRGSFNGSLLRAAAERTPKGMTVDVYSEMKSIPLFDEDLEGESGPDSVARLRHQVLAADGILIATPEYNQSMPGVLKNAIDWLSRPPDEVLAGKPVAIIGATTGRWGTRLAQAAVRQSLFAAEAIVLPKPSLFVRDAANAFDSEGRLTDQATRDMLEAVLMAFARWITSMAPRRSMTGR